MRPSSGSSACRHAPSPGHKGVWTRPLAWVLVGVVISLVLLTFTGGRDSVEAQPYSAYSDPEKPALSFILSDQQNVEAFQDEFGISDEQMESALAAVREENETLAQAYAESEREIEASGGESESAVSDYNAAVREAVAKTKSTVESLLPEDRRPQLGEWVDAKFAQEGQEAAESAEGDVVVDGGSRSVQCKVYASYYNGFTRYEVALPHQRLKFREQHRKVRIRPVADGRGARAPVKEVGPWNTRDNYWQAPKDRDMWSNLPRCVPEAQAAYFDNYNRGEDEFGREVRNPAGVDVTLAVAKRMGIRNRIQQKGVVRVYVRYPWVRR